MSAPEGKADVPREPGHFRFGPKAECRIVSIEHVVRSRQHAVSRSTLVNGERKKTGAAHG